MPYKCDKCEKIFASRTECDAEAKISGWNRKHLNCGGNFKLIPTIAPPQQNQQSHNRQFKQQFQQPSQQPVSLKSLYEQVHSIQQKINTLSNKGNMAAMVSNSEKMNELKKHLDSTWSQIRRLQGGDRPRIAKYDKYSNVWKFLRDRLQKKFANLNNKSSNSTAGVIMGVIVDNKVRYFYGNSSNTSSKHAEYLKKSTGVIENTMLLGDNAEFNKDIITLIQWALAKANAAGHETYGLQCAEVNCINKIIKELQCKSVQDIKKHKIFSIAVRNRGVVTEQLTARNRPRERKPCHSCAIWLTRLDIAWQCQDEDK